MADPEARKPMTVRRPRNSGITPLAIAALPAPARRHQSSRAPSALVMRGYKTEDAAELVLEEVALEYSRLFQLHGTCP